MNIPFPKTKGGPRKNPFVFCYICSRQFTKASLPIHEPQCLKKWKRENDKLPKSQRMPTPVKPKPMKEKKIKANGKYSFDESGWEAAQANLQPCKTCGRTFTQDRIRTHQRICRRTGIVPPVGQVKPRISKKSEFARRMSYQPSDPNSKIYRYRDIPSKLGLRRHAQKTAAPKRVVNRRAGNRTKTRGAKVRGTGSRGASRGQSRGQSGSQPRGQSREKFVQEKRAMGSSGLPYQIDENGRFIRLAQNKSARGGLQGRPGAYRGGMGQSARMDRSRFGGDSFMSGSVVQSRGSSMNESMDPFGRTSGAGGSRSFSRGFTKTTTHGTGPNDPVRPAGGARGGARMRF